MKKLNYKMIVSDFDHTLAKNDSTVSEENKRAIEEYRNQGGIFVISTGRLHYGIIPIAQRLKLNGLVACCQGAVVQDIESLEMILENTLSCELTVRICEKMEELGLHIHVYAREEYYCNKDDTPLKLYEKAVGKKARLVLDKPLSQFVKEKGICAYKLLAMVEPSENTRIKSELEKCNFEGCRVTKSADYLVEVINEKYSKGTAVEFLANRFSIPLEKVICVGDQENDIPMIQKAGLGIAVKNADEELKKCALVLEYTNEESAIAKIIEKYGFTED